MFVERLLVDVPPAPRMPRVYVISMPAALQSPDETDENSSRYAHDRANQSQLLRSLP